MSALYGIGFGAALLLMLAGLVAFLLSESMWRTMTKRGSRWANQASTAGALLFCGLGLSAVGLLVGSASDVVHGWHSTRWVETEAIVEHARIVEVSQIRSSNPAFRIEPTYRYRFDGRAHTASTLAFGNLASPNRDEVEREIAEHFSPGTAVRAFVNPANPAQAVLRPGVQATALIFGALGAAFLAISLWQLIALAKDWDGDAVEKRSKEQTKQQRAALKAARRDSRAG